MQYLSTYPPSHTCQPHLQHITHKTKTLWQHLVFDRFMGVTAPRVRSFYGRVFILKPPLHFTLFASACLFILDRTSFFRLLQRRPLRQYALKPPVEVTLVGEEPLRSSTLNPQKHAQRVCKIKHIVYVWRFLLFCKCWLNFEASNL